jgi:hypothetical protein
MTRKLSVFGFAAALCVIAAQVHADSILITPIASRNASAAETGAAAQPVPAGSKVYQWQVTTDGDILSISDISISFTNGSFALYQNTFGDPGNANKPSAGLDAAFPSITADTWIDTPGVGTRLGPDLPGDGTTTVGDTTNEGAQNNFIFAQLTLPGNAIGSFKGKVGIAGAGGTTVFTQVFDLPIGIPEPASAALAGFSLIGVAALRRRMA